MNTRQKSILEFISAQKLASASDIHRYIISRDHENISRITIIRDIDHLLKNNHIKKQGQARGVKYCPVIDNSLLEYFNVDAYFQKDPDNRAIKNKSFYFDVFCYLSSLLTDTELQEISFINEKFLHSFQKLTTTILKKEFERLTP